ncbi:hypothetical protein HPB49_003203 [Dermacentor silvarum]|uniref:Uncharacterized protein n=1 Tax=Dermacentor silvarum TaxID=543639 RepID=A0ACB8DTJ0_DERSI|nr:hypothetical protein HPB49_003203 [Dermacentor silvarum]
MKNSDVDRAAELTRRALLHAPNFPQYAATTREKRQSGIQFWEARGAGALETRKTVVCDNCGEKGHMARSCGKQVVFATIQDSDKNLHLLRPYIRQISVNGRVYRALRDSAATMDVAHPSCVSPDDFTGESAWIRQVAEKQSVCLPIARVVIEGPFGQLSTEAAISASLPDNVPYLFSNRSEQMLKERGESFSSEAAPKLEARKETRRLIGVFPIEQRSEDHGTIPEAAASGNETYVSVAECEGKTVKRAAVFPLQKPKAL